MTMIKDFFTTITAVVALGAIVALAAVGVSEADGTQTAFMGSDAQITASAE